MVNLNFDSKQGSVTGQALNCMLQLVAPVFRHKHGIITVLHHLHDNSVYHVSFTYQDQQFGCLCCYNITVSILISRRASWTETQE